MIIENQTNVNIEEDLIGTLTSTTTVDGTDDLGTAYYNAVYLVTSDIDGKLHIPREGNNGTPITTGWDRINGNAATLETSKLILGSVTPPTYYATNNPPAVGLVNVHGGTVNVKATLFGRGIAIEGCSDLIVTLDGSYLGEGIYMSNSNNIEVRDCKGHVIGGALLHTNRCDSIEARYNASYKACQSESNGGIYCQYTTNSILERNLFNLNGYGNYYDWDGGCFYMEHYSTDNIIRYNTSVNSEMGLQDDASVVSNVFHDNLVVDCVYPMGQTDGLGTGLGGKALYYDNMLLRTPDTVKRKPEDYTPIQTILVG